jgi:ubiquinone/menaquinone biosynthesis C-methylase UbiE
MPERLAERYDETSFWGARFGALLFDQLDIRPNVTGLEVGCGTGFPLIELANVHGPSSHFTGVDIWVEGLARARTKIDLLGLENVELVEADAVSMPFPNAKFDLIVSSLGVNNLKDPKAAFAECRRVAKKGARLAITTNVEGHFGAFYGMLHAILAERNLGAMREALRAEEAHRLSKEKIADLLSGIGFSVARSFEEGFEMRFADGSAMLRHPLVKWFLDGWREAIGPEHERDILETAEQRLDLAAEREGGIMMMVPMLYLEAVAV